jgi:hypothetical protein
MAWRHVLVCSVVLLAGCGVGTPPPPKAEPTAPAPTPTPVPKRPEDAADAFFTAWQQGQYWAMYDLLAADAQAATPKDVFVRRYTNIHDGVGELKLTIQAGAASSDNGQVTFQVTHSLAIFGDVTEANTLPLVQDQAGAWKVAW